jgi:ribosomal protein S14
MIRTVWLAAACLVVLGAMAAGKVANTPVAQTTDEKPLDGATVGSDLAREPLIKADRLEIAYVRQETPSQPTLQPIDPIVPEAPEMISPAETNIVSRHWHDPNDTNSSTAKPKRTAKKGRSAADSRDSQAADRSKPSEQTKRCDRTATFSGLLRSLNLAPACDS